MRRYLNCFTNEACILLLMLSSYTATAENIDMELGINYQYFPSPSDYLKDDFRGNAELYVAFEYRDNYLQDLITVNIDGYYNYNQRDNNRTLADFNAFSVSYFGNNFDLSAGIMTEFWGVTESKHLVDIINQTNIADDIDEETKLGQPMLNAKLYLDWGSVQVIWMPVFRERIFSSVDGRVRPALVIDDSLAKFESSDGKNHNDFAARYSHTLGIWDFGFSYFKGTARNPLLIPETNQENELVLAPYYEQIGQAGLDLQMTYEGLLLKVEAIDHDSEIQKNYFATVSGFEYTQVGLFNSSMDIGYIAEYLYDERGKLATTPFADDVFLGLRLIANNISQTTFLLGSYLDRDTDSAVWRLELETRLQDGLTLTLDGQAFTRQQPGDMLYDFKNDDYLTLGLQWYF